MLNMFHQAAVFVLALLIGLLTQAVAYAALNHTTEWWQTMLLSYAGLWLSSFLAGRLSLPLAAALLKKPDGRIRLVTFFAAALVICYAWLICLNPNPMPLQLMLELKQYGALLATAFILASGPLILCLAAKRSLKNSRR